MIHAREPIYDALRAVGDDGRPPLLTFDPPDPLTASLARESELLEALDHADHDGWVRALVVVHDHLTIAGLHQGAGVVDGLAAPPNTPTPHRLTTRIAPGAGIEYRVTCTAGTGADCRLTCEGSVRGLCDEQHSDACDRDAVDGGGCVAVPWFDHGDDTYLADAYAGPAHTFAPGPILVRWNQRDQDWEWMYPEDLPAGLTVEGWTRAATT